MLPRFFKSMPTTAESVLLASKSRPISTADYARTSIEKAIGHMESHSTPPTGIAKTDRDIPEWKLIAAGASVVTLTAASLWRKVTAKNMSDVDEPLENFEFNL